MKQKTYERPAMKVVRLQQRTMLLWSNELDEEHPLDACEFFYSKDPLPYFCIVSDRAVYHNWGDDIIDFVRHEGRPIRAVYVGAAPVRSQKARRRK